jgi:hypothetical protein
MVSLTEMELVTQDAKGTKIRLKIDPNPQEDQTMFRNRWNALAPFGQGVVLGLMLDRESHGLFTWTVKPWSSVPRA